MGQGNASQSRGAEPTDKDELSSYLDPSMSRFLLDISKAISKDPGLPRANPTVSSWQVPSHPLASVQSASLPQKTDFAVIGSGITGCSVTKTLLEHEAARDCHVTVLEARTLVSGATGRNGGHLVTASGHTFGPLAEQHGVEAAKEITRFSILNIERVMNMVTDMGESLRDECQMRHVIKVMAVGDDETWEAARTSVLGFQKAVPEHSTYHRIVDKKDVPERWNIKDASGAVEHNAGAIWPYRLLTNLYERLLQQHPDRLSIEANTPVLHVRFAPEEDASHPYAVRTPRGTIRAKKVMHCTNAYASHLLPSLAALIYPFRGTMSVHKPGPSFPNVGASLSWSLSEKPTLDVKSGLYSTGLFYLQQNPGTGRVWIGNETSLIEDILTSDDTYVPDEARSALETALPRMFLKGWDGETKSDIEAIWSGIQGHTADGLPIVGQVPASLMRDRGAGDDHGQDNGQWVAAGFNGYGMDKCWLTGEALVRIMFGEDVSAWFPQSYLLTDQRLETSLTSDQTLLKFAKAASP